MKKIVITEWHPENMSDNSTICALLQLDLNKKAINEKDLLNKLSRIIKSAQDCYGKNLQSEDLARIILNNLL